MKVNINVRYVSSVLISDGCFENNQSVIHAEEINSFGANRGSDWFCAKRVSPVYVTVFPSEKVECAYPVAIDCVPEFVKNYYLFRFTLSRAHRDVVVAMITSAVAGLRPPRVGWYVVLDFSYSNKYGKLSQDNHSNCLKLILGRCKKGPMWKLREGDTEQGGVK